MFPPHDSPEHRALVLLGRNQAIGDVISHMTLTTERNGPDDLAPDVLLKTWTELHDFLGQQVEAIQVENALWQAEIRQREEAQAHAERCLRRGPLGWLFRRR